MELIEVRDLKTRRKLLALYARGTVDRIAFHDAVAERLMAGSFLDAPAIPDPAAVYFERWAMVPWQRSERLMRCHELDSRGFDVTGVDLRKWSRGRKHRKAK